MPRRHQRHRDAVAKLDAVMPVERLGADRAVGAAHGEIVAERRDHARREFRGEFRQRRDVEMIVMAMRHQHDVDRRQRVERNAGIVVTLRSGPAERRGPLRPHRIDQDVQPRCLDQPAGVTDERQPHLVAGRRAAAACRRKGSAPSRARPAAAGRCRTASAAPHPAISAARRRDRKNACRRNDRRPGRHRFSCRKSRLAGTPDCGKRQRVRPHTTAVKISGPIGPKTRVSARGPSPVENAVFSDFS